MTDFQLSVDGPVAEIHLGARAVEGLARYEVDSALRLRDFMFDLGDDDDIKAIVLTAAPGGWSGGSPRREIRASEAYSGLFTAFFGDAGVYQQITYCRKPVVAAVEGECTGPGSLIALCSTLSVASEDARFWSPFADFPEANFGLAVFTMRLNRAKAWALRGRPMTADAARRFGLVNEVVANGQARARALRLAGEIAKRPLDAITMSRTQVWGFMDSRGVDRDFGVGALAAIATAAADGMVE